MTPKIDPYSTKLHTRINVLLLILTIVILVIVLRTSAHGQTAKMKSEWENNDDSWGGARSEFLSALSVHAAIHELGYGALVRARC
jgi:hypothetical protein